MDYFNAANAAVKADPTGKTTAPRTTETALPPGPAARSPTTPTTVRRSCSWTLVSPTRSRIHERYNITLFYQAFNMTNRANYGPNYDVNVSDAATSFLKPLGFINPSSTVVPRSFTGEFGARFSF